MEKPLISKEEAEKMYEEEIATKNIIPTDRVQRAATIEQTRMKTVLEISSLTDLAVDTLTSIMEDEKAKNPDKIRAAKLVLEYAIGRPREANYVDDAAFNKKGNVGRIIIEGQVSPDDVRKTIEANFYEEGEGHGG